MNAVSLQRCALCQNEGEGIKYEGSMLVQDIIKFDSINVSLRNLDFCEFLIRIPLFLNMGRGIIFLYEVTLFVTCTHIG